MDPTTGRFEQLTETVAGLVRPNGSPVPKTWLVLTVGELVTIKEHTFKVMYCGETSVLLEPVKPEDAIGG